MVMLGYVCLAGLSQRLGFHATKRYDFITSSIQYTVYLVVEVELTVLREYAVVLGRRS
jgi:hypothetical protein